MYRIALQLTAATNTKPATFQYIVGEDGIEPWSTDSIEEALARYQKELDNYKKSIITLVHIVDVNMTLTADPCDSVQE